MCETRLPDKSSSEKECAAPDSDLLVIGHPGITAYMVWDVHAVIYTEPRHCLRPGGFAFPRISEFLEFLTKAIYRDRSGGDGSGLTAVTFRPRIGETR